MNRETRKLKREYRRHVHGQQWDRGLKQWMADTADGSCPEEWPGQHAAAQNWMLCKEMW